MEFQKHVETLRELHTKAKVGDLTPEDQARYQTARDELARVVLLAQQIGVQPGQPARRAVRATRVLQAHIEVSGGAMLAVTVQLSAGGFGALLTKAPNVGDEVKVALHVRKDTFHAAARVLNVTPQGRNFLASFQFVGLSEAESERLQMLVFDTILDQLPQEDQAPATDAADADGAQAAKASRHHTPPVMDAVEWFRPS
jgi:hypothetical protein